MSMNSLLADALTRIRNAQNAGHESVIIPFSNLLKASASVLHTTGYIEGFEVIEAQGKNGKTYNRSIVVGLKYYRGKPVISQISMISRPGCRIYRHAKEIVPHRNGYGVIVISTPQGLKSDNEARAAKLGGEVLFTVF